MRFVVKSEHLELLNRLNIRWCDNFDGAPHIDIKRPYGNSDVLDDVCDVLGMEKTEIASGELVFTAQQNNVAKKVHREMEFVLQIICQMLKCECGTYERDDYGYRDWRKVDD